MINYDNLINFFPFLMPIVQLQLRDECWMEEKAQAELMPFCCTSLPTDYSLAAYRDLKALKAK